jgi:hypothetical protein
VNKIQPPKTVNAATQLLERYADLTARVELVEADRAERVANANAWADTAAQPMLEDLVALGAALEAWWMKGGSDVAGGKKSAELGGCSIGLRMARAKLAHGFESDDKAIEALRGTRWAKQTTKIKYSLDRPATLKLLQMGGKAGSDVAALGFSVEPGNDSFFVQRSA